MIWSCCLTNSTPPPISWKMHWWTPKISCNSPLTCSFFSAHPDKLLVTGDPIEWTYTTVLTVPRWCAPFTRQPWSPCHQVLCYWHTPEININACMGKCRWQHTMHCHGPAQLECVEILSLSWRLILNFVHIRELVLGSKHNDSGWVGSRDIHY